MFYIKAIKFDGQNSDSMHTKVYHTFHSSVVHENHLIQKSFPMKIEKKQAENNVYVNSHVVDLSTFVARNIFRIIIVKQKQMLPFIVIVDS